MSIAVKPGKRRTPILVGANVYMLAFPAETIV